VARQGLIAKKGMGYLVAELYLFLADSWPRVVVNHAFSRNLFGASFNPPLHHHFRHKTRLCRLANAIFDCGLFKLSGVPIK
jgi:hypothetical protein